MISEAKLITNMTLEELNELNEKEHLSLLISSFSRIYGRTTSALYCGKSGKLYYETGTRRI